VYGLVCGVVLVLFFVLNFYNISEGKFTTDLPEELDPRNVRFLSKTTTFKNLFETNCSSG
jgi:hypothetical protein